MERIESASNAKIKWAASLHQRKNRERCGEFVAEGVRLTEMAAASDWPLRFCIVTESALAGERVRKIIDALEAKGCPIFVVPPNVYKKASATETPQGVLLVMESVRSSLAELPAKGNPLFVVLDRIRDPGNVGTIIRTADAVGALGIILLEGCVDAFSPKVVRASMGSLFHLPVIQDVFPEEALTWCYRHGYEPAATALKNAQNMYKADLSKKMAFIFGNEANGVAEELQAAAETRLFIPMAGQAESMNVAMAAGIILFEGLRQRKFFR